MVICMVPVLTSEVTQSVGFLVYPAKTMLSCLLGSSCQPEPAFQPGAPVPATYKRPFDSTARAIPGNTIFPATAPDTKSSVPTAGRLPRATVFPRKQGLGIRLQRQLGKQGGRLRAFSSAAANA